MVEESIGEAELNKNNKQIHHLTANEAKEIDIIPDIKC